MSDPTILRAADAPDYTGDAPGAFLGYGRPLGASQVAVNMRFGEGGETLGLYDAVLVPPETVRSVRNDSDEEARLVMISGRGDSRSETTWHERFWVD